MFPTQVGKLFLKRHSRVQHLRVLLMKVKSISAHNNINCAEHSENCFENTLGSMNLPSPQKAALVAFIATKVSTALVSTEVGLEASKLDLQTLEAITTAAIRDAFPKKTLCNTGIAASKKKKDNKRKHAESNSQVTTSKVFTPGQLILSSCSNVTNEPQSPTSPNSLPDSNRKKQKLIGKPGRHPSNCFGGYPWRLNGPKKNSPNVL